MKGFQRGRAALVNFATRNTSKYDAGKERFKNAIEMLERHRNKKKVLHKSSVNSSYCTSHENDTSCHDVFDYLGTEKDYIDAMKYDKVSLRKADKKCHKNEESLFATNSEFQDAFGNTLLEQRQVLCLSLIHICRCRRYAVCRSRWSPYH
eukprot:TRINITY_DN19235_c0_g1_i1.p1 TRINITY_DN19235_c0_g1~~TRINITY_DN19235_c0_g1_i1.p1  ORF type:complete len:150 (+),score=9.57 TRINITY_DN19235_c0_g1_i1:83-532(+)